MAVGYSDNRFDWCDSLAYAKRNYNNAECCNIIKNKMKELKGADDGFIRAVTGMKTEEFSFSYYWFPVYEVTVTATYIWDTKETEDKGSYTVDTTTTHTHTNTFTQDVFTGIYSSCNVGTYVGRNDQRFYKLSHVNDLDGSVYNDNCVYSSGQMAGEVRRIARAEDPGSDSDMTINRWGAKVYFIPVVVIKYSYGGSVYSATVNMHNGYSYYEYKISAHAGEWAEKGHKASKLIRIFTAVTAVAGVGLLTALFNGRLWFLKLLIYAAFVTSAVVLIVKGFKLKHDLSYFRNTYGNKGNVGSKAYSDEIKYLIILGVIFIICFILFCILR